MALSISYFSIWKSHLWLSSIFLTSVSQGAFKGLTNLKSLTCNQVQNYTIKLSITPKKAWERERGRERQTDRWRESEKQTDRQREREREREREWETDRQTDGERERKSIGGTGKCKKNAMKSKTVHRIQMGSKFYCFAMAMNRVNLERKRGIQIVHLRTDMILLGLEKGVRCYLKFQLRRPYIYPPYICILRAEVYSRYYYKCKLLSPLCHLNFL